MLNMRKRRLVVGVSGASGSIYAVRLLQALQPVAGIETHLIISNAGKRTLLLETDVSVAELHGLADRNYPASDIGAAVASGSFRTDAMVVIPCSMKTVSGIANCYSDNLLLRAADVALKERRRLVLVVRETPLHLGHLRLLTQVTEVGAVVLPPVPAFYTRPTTLDDVINHTVARVLDLLGIELEDDLAPRWEPAAVPTRVHGDRLAVLSESFGPHDQAEVTVDNLCGLPPRSSGRT